MNLLTTTIEDRTAFAKLKTLKDIRLVQGSMP